MPASRTPQHRILLCIALACAVVGHSQPARATSVLPLSADEQLARAAAVFSGTVVGVHSYQGPDGLIYTRTVLRVDEAFKGKLPPLVKLVHRGGEVAGRGMSDDSSPQFRPGEERLLFVGQRPDGSLFAARGEAGALPAATAGSALLSQLRTRTLRGTLAGSDLTAQSASAADLAAATPNAGVTPLASPSSIATNLTAGGDGIPARFLQPDRGEPIPYLIDADYLPTGMTLTQAVSAVQSAIAAWAGPTSLKYRFAGIQSFGMAAGAVTTQDGYLRIQLHDHYHFITGTGDTLGIGGHGWIVANTTTSGWTTGGNVAGSDFHRVYNGYVVLAHTNTFMQNVTNFAEVLCHEVGHTIGLAHSSENPSEPSSYLKQAVMYYAAHGNGRGATLNGWDTNVVRQSHPPGNTPPFCYDRFLDAVSSPTLSFSTPGVNTIQVGGYDLQGGALTMATDSATSGGGNFSVSGTNITFVLTGYYDTGDTRIDPASGSYYAKVNARFSDGTNASPYMTLRVVSLNADTSLEGTPDRWRQAFFGDADASVGLHHHATDDADGDGVNNITEWQLGSNPTNAASNLRITSFSPLTLQFPAKGYEVYELYASTNLTNWRRVLNPIVPTNFVPGTDFLNVTNSIGVATGFTNGAARQFYRLQKVP